MAPATRCIDWSDSRYDFFACRIASLQRAALPTDWDGAGRGSRVVGALREFSVANARQVRRRHYCPSGE
jgi:hypothetical protein